MSDFTSQRPTYFRLLNLITAAFAFLRPAFTIFTPNSTTSFAVSPPATTATTPMLPTPPTLSPPKKFNSMATVRLCLGMVVSCISYGDGTIFEPTTILRNADTFRVYEEPTHPVAIGMHVQFYYVWPGDGLEYRWQDGELAVVTEIEAVGREWTCFRVHYSTRPVSALLMVPNEHAEWNAEWTYIHDYLKAVQQLPTVCVDSTAVFPKGTVNIV
ncbi:hypothetical protein PHLCEN_2v11635 [Hermanssonia centrifuga]|uniref:Uncharacterized protein n=1 Tax=Hermanssonia centrifuga TaxID=98765 RepID=A0A2R6NJG7_9APHY|nr:hypothetical protein PHLCEN_2v11635 [Hermanssonia centrifuga]